jgi:hypothetical protein
MAFFPPRHAHAELPATTPVHVANTDKTQQQQQATVVRIKAGTKNAP